MKKDNAIYLEMRTNKVMTYRNGKFFHHIANESDLIRLSWLSYNHYDYMTHFNSGEDTFAKQPFLTISRRIK